MNDEQRNVGVAITVLNGLVANEDEIAVRLFLLESPQVIDKGLMSNLRKVLT